MKAADTIELSATVNALNAHRMNAVQRRVHAFLGVLLAIAMGIGLGLLLLMHSVPCEGASLCMAAVIPTRRNWLQRPVLDVQRWRLLRQIRTAQQDLVYQHESLELANWECEHLPRQMAVTRAHIDRLAAQMDALDTPEVR